ncbi:DNA processing protein [Caldicoprobacter guelmensis]|uniref:DNA-processing protein DprA n=1 Tax=Caldicoprobacter guelmensis TaxID=1170224 RepID=UPI001956AD24|nr:DNA processing protein [Caldicoprobacter guelmensis]
MEDIEDKVYWIWLSSIPGIGAKRFYYLVKRFGSPRAVWECGDEDILDACGLIGDRVAQNLITHKSMAYLEKAQKIAEDPEIEVITLIEDEYPKLLKTIYDPPPVLYCKGQPLRETPYMVSIVGSRRTSEYGRQMAERLAYDLSCAGVTVVSGLARGIDAMAHRGALRAGGYTIGVLGCGVDVVYPRENKKLFMQVQQQGTLISEYPPGTQPAAGNFPARNRIISGLSQAVLVVEAGNTSGALITVDFALEQGREVYALPGNVTSPYSSGTNQLIKEGARPITCADDILEDLGITVNKEVKRPSVTSYQLDIFEAEVYNALEDGEKQLEELAAITGFEIGKLNAILTLLEMKGIVKQLPGGKFVRQLII